MAGELHGDYVINTGSSHVGVEGMPQVVEGEVRDSSVFQRGLQCFVDALHRIALVGEHVIVRDSSHLVRLFQHLEGLGDQVDLSRLLRLGVACREGDAVLPPVPLKVLSQIKISHFLRVSTRII